MQIRLRHGETINCSGEEIDHIRGHSHCSVAVPAWRSFNSRVLQFGNAADVWGMLPLAGRAPPRSPPRRARPPPPRPGRRLATLATRPAIDLPSLLRAALAARAARAPLATCPCRSHPRPLSPSPSHLSPASAHCPSQQRAEAKYSPARDGPALPTLPARVEPSAGSARVRFVRLGAATHPRAE